jgi:two-component system, NtrC family, response regulator GlrR
MTSERSEAQAHEALGGESRAMQIVRQRIREYGPAEATVLIGGETGTGKDLTARALHAASPRAAGPFVAVNCAALPSELVESELFGSTRGAFTGASQTRPGLFDAARGGTLLLDEIGELPRRAQAKLLRVLEAGGYRPLGAIREKQAEARVLAATNRDLTRLCASGEFRLDLYYRVAVLRIELPPLRERRADIPGLVQRFLQRAGRAPEVVAPEAMARLFAHDWPGNVRELRSVVERSLLRAGAGGIREFDLEEAIEPAPSVAPAAPGSAESVRVLLEHRGRLAAAAAALGVSPRTLQRRLRAGGLSARRLRRELALPARP